MAASRAEFFTTLRAMLALTQDALLTDTLPISAIHNTRARVLRHGLSVTAFAMLEKYAEGCFHELVAGIGTSAVKYSSFSDKLKRFLTIDAVFGLSKRLDFMDAADQQGFIDAQILRLAGYNNNPPIYTALGFSPRGSNVSHAAIKDAFSACGVENPWEKMSQIASAIGSSRLSLSADYRNLSKTRHSSAHNPTGNVASSDLATNIETAIIIGIAIDVLATALAAAFSKARTLSRLETAIGSLTHRFRFVDEQPDGSWAERYGGRIVKRYRTEEDACAGALSRAIPSRVISRNARQVPITLWS